MKASLFSLIALLAPLVVASGARADASTSSIKFSDPSKPGTLRILLAGGALSIQGADASAVTVTSDTPAHPPAPRPDGLRVLTEASSFSLSEKGNVVTLDAGAAGWFGSPSRLQIAVPRNTNVIVANSFDGNITCGGTTGDIDVRSLNGQVRLQDVRGSALVETTNGAITADIRALHAGKPLSFTSTNGAVLLRVPAEAKANVRLRTQNGTILTDFDERALVTQVEGTPGGAHHSGGGILTPEARQAFREAARASAEAARQAAEAVREAAEAAREGVEGLQKSNGRGAHPAPVAIPALPPIPPIPAIPAMTGGKLVTGTLNGGGPEIDVATMNGNVTLRKL